MWEMVSLRSCRLGCGRWWVWGPVDSDVGDGEFEVLSTRMWEMVSLRSCRLGWEMVSLRSCRLGWGRWWVWGPVDSDVGHREFEVLSTRMWEMVSLRSCRLGCGRWWVWGPVDSDVGDREFEVLSIQTKKLKIGICYFPANHAVLRSKRKYWLSQTQDSCKMAHFALNIAHSKTSFISI